MLMGYEEKLKEGLLIELEVNEGDYPGKYRTKVEALHQNIITIGVPIHDGQFVPLREGTKISVYFHDEVSNYGFVSQILRRVTEPIPIFIIVYPDQVFKVQRREYYRIPIVKEIKYQIIGQEGLSKMYKGYMLNLSGGGILLRTKSKLYPHTKVLLTLELAQEKMKVPAKVVRFVEEDKNDYRISLEFFDISERERDRIIAFVYKLQREMRRKGLD